MPLAEFEEWWRQPKQWLIYPQAQKQAAKAAWDYFESKFTDAQQLKAKIAALANELSGLSRSDIYNGEHDQIAERMRQLSAV
ncbi:MAG: hypothetical protein ACWGNI_00060 [Desulfobacterales bacterium]